MSDSLTIQSNWNPTLDRYEITRVDPPRDQAPPETLRITEQFMRQAQRDAGPHAQWDEQRRRLTLNFVGEKITYKVDEQPEPADRMTTTAGTFGAQLVDHLIEPASDPEEQP